MGKYSDFRKTLAALSISVYNTALLAFQNFKDTFRRNRSQGILIFGGFITIITLSSMFSIFLFNREVQVIENQPLSYTYTGNSDIDEEEEQDEEGESGEEANFLNVFLNAYNEAIEFFTPVFDSFISQTADPTGKSAFVEDGYSFTTFGFGSTYFTTGTEIRSALEYSNKLLAIVVPVFVILISLQAFNILKDPDNSGKLRDLGSRVLTTVILTIATPYILSLSILGANLLSFSLTEGQPLTEFMSQFVEGVKDSEYAEAGLFDTSFSLFGGFSIVSLVNAIPVFIPLVLILLLFLFISFQFILRFLNLYFLTAVYPFATIFAAHPETSSITRTYWKQWVSFLVHQPVFILGYVVVQDMLFDMLNEGVGMEQVLIFLALLLFLSSINMLAARLWGDVYAALSSNIQAAIGTGAAVAAIKAPINKGREMAGDFKRGALGGGVDSFSSYAGRKLASPSGFDSYSKSSSEPGGAGNMSRGNKLGGKVSHQVLKDATESFLARDLASNGYKVSARDDGNLDLSGNFYAAKNTDSGYTTLYSSRADAALDGVKNPTQKSFNNLGIRDTSNYAQTQDYNRALGKFKANKGLKQKTHLKETTEDKWVGNNMKIGKGINTKSGINGIMTKRFANKAKRGDPNGQILKIHIYDELE